MSTEMYSDWLHLSLLCFCRKAIGDVTEEIMVKNARDAPQQLQIDVLLSEYLINIRTGTAQLAGEPCDGTSLFVKYAFYKLTGMKHNCYGTKTNIILIPVGRFYL